MPELNAGFLNESNPKVFDDLSITDASLKATASDEPASPEADLFLLCRNYGTVIKSYWSLPIPSAFMAVS